MPEKWKVVNRLDPRYSNNRLRLRYLPEEALTVVEVLVEDEKDITSECKVELVQSRHSGGYYCSIIHNGKSILALGIDEASKCILKPNYRIVKAENASVSFRILKKPSERR